MNSKYVFVIFGVYLYVNIFILHFKIIIVSELQKYNQKQFFQYVFYGFIVDVWYFSIEIFFRYPLNAVLLSAVLEWHDSL